MIDWNTILNRPTALDRGPYDQQVSPVVTPANPTGVGTSTPEHPLSTLIKTLLAPNQNENTNATSGNNTFGQLADALLKIHGGVRTGLGGQPATAENPTGDPRNPFGTGFFKSAAERAAIENARGVGATYGAVGSAYDPTKTLPTMTPDEQRNLRIRYGPKTKSPGYPYGLPLYTS